jgi:hypothetical protein
MNGDKKRKTANRRREAEKRDDEVRESGEEEKDNMKDGNIRSVYFASTSY